MQLASQYSERWLVQITITADIVIWAGRDDNLKRVLPAFLNLEDTGLTHLEPEIRVHRQIMTEFDKLKRFHYKE